MFVAPSDRFRITTRNTDGRTDERTEHFVFPDHVWYIRIIIKILHQSSHQTYSKLHIGNIMMCMYMINEMSTHI